MTPITRESARLAVSELPPAVSQAKPEWPLHETALDVFSDWVAEQLADLEVRFGAFRTRTSLRAGILGQRRAS
jgi:hypothetical protein